MKEGSPRPVLKWIRVDRIDFNGVNPNKMSDEQFHQFVVEVRRLQRLPKPVVVRSVGSRYQVADGEHGVKAARVVGLTVVLCEIVEADDYELKLQCFKRNLGGTNDPVLLADMFEMMKAERGLSNRELAEDLGISEGSVRNTLQYATAARLRTRYASQDRRGEIAEQRRVRAYRFNRVSTVGFPD